MARTNTARSTAHVRTHEGAPAFAHMTPLQALKRSVLSCLLWEREFYEDGVEIADRIRGLALKVDPQDLAALAIQARTQFKLRHAPLWLLVALAKTGSGTPVLGNAIPQVVKRADELAELVSLYWAANPRVDKQSDAKSGRGLPAQMKKGLARAFANFKEYHFAKYDRESAVKLRDVLFLAHPKPGDRAELYKRIADRTLETPDTWEVELSGGKDKKETFERLIREGKLGYLALLRNLRNMADAGCDAALVKDAILARKGADRVLPFRYVAASRAAPRFEPEIDKALLACIDEMPVLRGRTAVLVDHSGSMNVKLSQKSDMTRLDAAAALASIIPAIDLRVFVFSDMIGEVPPRKGMAGVDVIRRAMGSGGTNLGAAVQAIENQVPYDRLIVITDEQSHDRVPEPKARGYMINVASAQHGVGYGKWVHLDGFSESVLSFIREHEAQ